jgi:ligand-binding sensor domain-containing protein
MFALLLVWSAHASPAPRAVPGLSTINVAALVSTPKRLYVAGFDEGLFVVEGDGPARRFQHAGLSPHINALAWSERTQTLWLGTARGLMRCLMTRQPRCEQVGSTSAVHALLLRSDDSLVAGGDAGLTFVGAGTRQFGKKQGAPFRSVWGLAEADGRLFVGTTNGLFWARAAAFAPGGAKLERAAVVLGSLPDDWVTALLAAPGQLLVGTYNAGVVRFAVGPSGLAADGRDGELGYVNPSGLFALDDQRLAIASMDGLHAGRLGSTTRLTTRGNDVTAIAPAHGGGYWVGTRHGLEWIASFEPS